MRLWRRFKSWVIGLVKDESSGSVNPTPTRDIPPPIPSVTVSPANPNQLPLFDDVDNGDVRNPDWFYIASNAKLDKDGLYSTVLWYQKEAFKNRSRYENVGNSLGIPWWFIAALHMRESGMNFAGVLHNGDEILGTGRLTYRVPKGRGPFDTWEASAIDALKMKGFHMKKAWSLGDACAYSERFNGLGYRNKGEYSPYVCAGTSFHDETGKYVSDGRYSRSAVEKQPGVLALWIALGVQQ